MGVEICTDKINYVCDKLINMDLKYHNWKDSQFIDSDDINQMIQFFFIGNAINFRFWYTGCKERYTYGNYDGSAAMWAFLKNNLRLINPEYISTLEVETEPEVMKMPMAFERVMALRETGKELLKNFEGSALKLCEYCNWNAPTIVKMITEYFPTWKDEQRNIKFNKRAQLFVCMLHGRLGSDSKLTDINKLTCLADYQLPRVLKYLGILKYSNRLEQIIESQTLIAAGSDDEFSIRYSTIQAVDLICRELNRHKIDVNPAQLDYTLWNLAKNVPNSHHLTVTMAY
jgi:hypothetical protein